MKKLFLLVVLLTLLLVSCSPKEVVLVEPDVVVGGCTQKEYIDATADIEAEWLDAVELAESTSRMNLPDRISEMQAILRDYKKVDVAECYQDIHGLFISSYKQTISGFLKFMSDEADSVVTTAFKSAIRLFEEGQEKLWELPFE